MRATLWPLLVSLVFVTSAFAGCIGGADESSNPNEEIEATNATPGSEDSRETSTSNESLSGSNESRGLTVTFEETHEGSVPRAPQMNGTDPSQVFSPFFVSYPVPVDEGDRLLNVSYNATYTRATNVVINVYDPSGEQRADSLEECESSDLMPQVQAERSCQMEVGSPNSDLAQGEWTVELVWQVGEATESYTLDLTVKGLAPGSS